MMAPAPYYSDDFLTLLHGDASATLAALPSASAQTCVTSPPYFGLRDYGTGDAQVGLEGTPDEYVARLVGVFAEVRRVLRPDGTLWLNLGDSYYSGRGSPTLPDEKQSARRGFTRVLDRGGADWAKPKDLLGIPWRVAFALQADGWYLRNAIVWDKPNAMPSSVDDRLSNTYELMFLLSTARRYYFDLDAIREPLAHPDALARGIVFGGHNGGQGKVGSAKRPGGGHRSVYGGKGHGHARPQTGKDTDPAHRQVDPAGRNPGDVWAIPTTPYPGAHFAVMPPELVRRCVLAGSREGDTVLDPFIGSGTVAMVANRHGRPAVGIDLSEEYLGQALARCKDAPLPFGEAS